MYSESFTMELEPISDAKSKNDAENSSHPGWLLKRYLLAGILCLGSFCLSSLNKNTSMALIEMTKNKTIEINGTLHTEPEFNWNSKQKGFILSTFAYGHLSSFLIPWIVKKYGGVKTYGFSFLYVGIINVLHPFTVRFSFNLFLVIRIIEGTLMSFTYLSTFEILSKWAPNKERSKLVAITCMGSYIANAAIFPISGYLSYLWQWPSTFYFTGGMAISVSSLILLTFSNEPSTDRHSSEIERKYMMREVEAFRSKKANYPWKLIFTSIPLWAFFIMRFSNVCGILFIGLCLPQYVEDMTNLDIHEIGILSGIPNTFGIIMIPVFGAMADYIQKRKILNPTQVHKTYTFIGLVLGGCCYISITLVKGTNFAVNVSLLIAVKILLSLSDLVAQFVPLYMAPNHSCLIVSIVSYAYSLALWSIPMLIGYVVTTPDAAEWNIVLLSLGVILLTGGLTFIFFGTSEAQPWIQTDSQRKPAVQNTENRLG